MINVDRLVKTFCDLVRVDSVSRHTRIQVMVNACNGFFAILWNFHLQLSVCLLYNNIYWLMNAKFKRFNVYS